jgi:uncharacterized protein
MPAAEGCQGGSGIAGHTSDSQFLRKCLYCLCFSAETDAGMTIAQNARPAIAVPDEIGVLVSMVRERLRPSEIWLFGSRARGTAGRDSDWDLLAVLDDNAAAELSDPVLAWRISRESNVRSTVLTTRRSDLEEIWGLPNTLGYDLAREGVRLIVD